MAWKLKTMANCNYKQNCQLIHQFQRFMDLRLISNCSAVVEENEIMDVKKVTKMSFIYLFSLPQYHHQNSKFFFV